MPLVDDKKALCRLLTALVLFANLPAWGGDKSKDEESIKNAATVLQAMLHKGIVPASLLATANCILILPHVKHFAVGVGGSGGHGPLTCRKGKNFSGNGWSTPAMYNIGGANAGLQFGSSSTDFVALILAPSAANRLLEGKVRVGNDITATVGAQTSTGWVAGGDIVAFGRAKGLFAGTSLNGATLEPDDSADQRLYQKGISARDIVLEDAVKPTPAGQSLISLLERVGTS
jgi:lipid-binding SYLF domain-containing protein